MTACRYTWSCTSPAAKTPGTLVSVDFPLGQQVAAVRLVIELIEEQRRVRVVPDGDEHAVGGELGFVTRDGVAQPDAGHLVVAEHLTDDLVEDELDLLVRARPVDHDRRRAELLPPVDDDDPAREAGDEQRLLHRRVATADDDHDLSLKNAASQVAQYETLRPCSSRSDSSPSWRALAPVAMITDSAWYSSSPTHTRKGRWEKSTRVTSSVTNVVPNRLGLAAEVLHHRRPHDAVGAPG